LAEIQGVYVPSFFTPRYDHQGRFLAVEPRRPGYEKVRRRILPELDAGDCLSKPLVPQAKIIHDRLGIEIARGCTRGCRFCQAGVIYRPVRERSPGRVLELAAEGIDRSGFEELALLSLSTGDYACLPEVLVALMDRFAGKRVSVSMPSMRVGTLTPEIMTQIKRVRKTGFTLAPEAGSDRLRQVINKGISEEDLLVACRAAFDLGWQQIKLYFMFGLPTETPADLQAIPELAGKVLQTAPNGRAQVNVSVATFVPKPHTVFQREPQLSMAEGFSRLDFLKKRLNNRRFRLKWHDPRSSFLEGVLSRGDRKLSLLVEEAWRQGARLDAWSDHFDLEIWRLAAKSCGMDLDSYLQRRSSQEPLPWQHLDPGVDPAFLEAELARAMAGIYTPDCRVNGCQHCGLCDFKTIRPVVHGRKPQILMAAGDGRKVKSPAAQGRFLYQLVYSRLEKGRLLSHLEIMRMFFRAFRRLELPLRFSEGFNPTPRVSFGPALPVGTESREEFLTMELSEPIAEPEAVLGLLNRQLPEGFEAIRLEVATRDKEGATLTCYHINLAGGGDAQLALAKFRQTDNFGVTIERKGDKRHLDVRPLVQDLSECEDGIIQLIMASEPGRAGVKPMELLTAVLGISEEESRQARVMKVWSRRI
jgi:radical SAM-linked protein